MKLISLNTWGGKIYQPLISFIGQYAKGTDIFCFQEIYTTTSDVKQHRNIRANLLQELAKILPNFQYFYSLEMSGFDSTPVPVDFDLSVGKTIFIRNDIKVNITDDILLYGDRSEKFLKNDFSNLPVTLQAIDFSIDQKQFTLVNIHGTAFPGDKLDTQLRINHSAKIKEFLKTKPGGKILTGDFNLLPETQGIKILENDMRNLIKEFKIEKTRSKLSPFSGKPDFQKFADYTFVSSNVNVINFQVPDIEISDHLPMILEFS